MSPIRQIVILAGGKGTRLGTHARSTPKPLMRIDDGSVFLDHIVDNAARQGFRDIFIVAGHLGEQIFERFHNIRVRGADVSVFVEPEARGTGGALTFVEEHLAGAFLVTNGDTFFDVNFRALSMTLETRPELEAVLALREIDDVARYGEVQIGDAGIVTSFVEKNAARSGRRGFINGGIYALRRKALGRIRHSPASIETDLFPEIVASGQMAGVSLDGYFIDIGLPETLEIARRELPRRLRPCLFLDRDGVLNHDVHHLYRHSDWRWIDGAIETIRAANDTGIAVVVVTNQAGVAKGYYAEHDVVGLHEAVRFDLAARGAFVDEFYYCPYHAEAVDETYRVPRPFDRKPAPNMLLRAARQQKLDLRHSLFVGDQESDRQAAEAAGLPFLHYRSGNLFDLVRATPAWTGMVERGA